MSAENELFMHALHENLQAKFHEDRRSPEDVGELFSALGFEDVPENILKRLSLLSDIEDNKTKKNSHFQDAVEISEIIDNLVEEESLTETELNELRYAALVHDVGKSGPAEATPEEQAAYVELYNLNFDHNQYEFDGKTFSPQEVSIEKALAIKVQEGRLTQEQADRTLELVLQSSKKQKVKRFDTKLSKKTPMGTFWSAHVYWTYDILKESSVKEEITDVAASHHIIDGHDPAQIGIDNVTSTIASLEMADKYQAFRVRLILADKYQAFRKRGAKSHEDTIAIMKGMIEEKLFGHDKALAVYMQVLGSIDKHKEIFEKELDLDKVEAQAG